MIAGCPHCLFWTATGVWKYCAVVVGGLESAVALCKRGLVVVIVWWWTLLAFDGNGF